MRCEYCDKIIDEDEEYYDIDGHTICIDCVMDWLDENRKEVNEEGEEIYVLNDMEWSEDELNRALLIYLKICEEPTEHGWDSRKEGKEFC